MKRTVLVFVLVILVASAMVVWSEGQTESEEKVLVVWSWQHEPLEKIMNEKVIPSFESKNPNVKIDFETPGRTSEVNEKFVISSQGGAAPDVVGLQHAYLPNHVYLGNVDPVDLEVFGVNSMKEYGDLWAGGHAILGWEDNYYGVAIEASSYTMVINAEHFREAGLDPDHDYPLTWEKGDRSVASIGKKLTKREGDKIVREGYGLATHPSGSMLVYYNMLGNLGKELLKADGKSTNITSSESRRILQTLRDFTFDSKISLPGGLRNAAIKREEFQNGTASMMNTIWSWYDPVIAQYPDVYKNGDGVKFIKNPSYFDGNPYSTKYGALWVVSSQSENKKEAWTFQKELLSYAEDFLATGLFVPVKGYEKSAGAQQAKDFDLFADILALPGSEQIRTGEATAIWQNALVKVLFEDADIDEALETAEKEFREYLPEIPYSMAAK
jgi:multiple sugar transport system substrate-binding protein